LAIYIGAITSIGFVLISAAMNWRFGASFGRSTLDAFLYGCASALGDILKAVLPFLIAWSITARRPLGAMAGITVWLVCLVFSLTSAVGFASLNRADTAKIRALQASHLETLQIEQARLRKKLGWLPEHRPEPIVRLEITAAKDHPRWRSSAECRNATIIKSRVFCNRYRQLEVEQASAAEAARIETRLSEISKELANQIRSDASTSRDPQVVSLTRITGQPRNTVRMSLIVLMATLLEVGSSLGLFVALSCHSEGPQVSRPARRSSGNRRMSGNKPNLRLVSPPACGNTPIGERLEPVRSFMNLYTEECECGTIDASVLYERYRLEISRQGHPGMSQKMFGTILRDLGYTTKKRSRKTGRVQYCGLTWREPATNRMAA